MVCSSLTASAQQATASQSCSQNWYKSSGWMPWSPCVQTYWSGLELCHLPPRYPLRPEEHTCGLSFSGCTKDLMGALELWVVPTDYPRIKGFSAISPGYALGCSREQEEMRSVFQSNYRWKIKARLFPATHQHLIRWSEYVFIQPAHPPLSHSRDIVGYSNEPNNVGMTEVKNLIPVWGVYNPVRDRRHVHKLLC